MEKTIEISGKKVSFKSTGATPLRYKNQFHRDFLVDIMKMKDLAKVGKNPSYEELMSLDMEVFYNICWTLAKSADKSIPEPIEWLDEFEEFPIMEIIPQIQELITSSLGTKKK